MRTALLLVLVLCASAASADVPGYENYDETEHLRFAWNEGAITDEGVAAIKLIGETYYRAIVDMLGAAPEHRILILVEGPAGRPDGQRSYPHVDTWGRLHLYRFGPTYHDYLGAFSHELVHAMRIMRRPHHDWFFEEGLAEFIALRLEQPLRGFPWYGFPVVIAAGQWLASGGEISLADLREKHQELNQPCRAQSYTLRSAFFDHLGMVHGDDAVLQMAKEAKAGAITDYEIFLGKDFDALVEEWRTALLAAFETTEHAEVEGTRYRNETPIQYMPVCDSSGQPRR